MQKNDGYLEVLLRMNKITLGTILLLAFLASCTAEENLDDLLKNEERPQVNAGRIDQNLVKNDFHILVIGNSFSRDAFSYVPAIMNDVCNDKTFEVNILYKSGKALSTHWNSINKELADYILDSYDNDNSKWQIHTNVLAKDIITSKEWDIVVLQEGSGKARSYDLTQPSVHHIAGYIREIQPNVNVAFMINPPHADGYSDLGEYTSEEIWMQYVQTAKQLLENNEINYIIPCGTGIQNARKTYLDSLGVFGHLTYDGRHLQEGIPCLIEAYTASQSLFNLFSINASINGSSLKITQQWVNDHKIPGQQGIVIKGTDDDYQMSKKCAISAIDSPYSIFENQHTTSIQIPNY